MPEALGAKGRACGSPIFLASLRTQHMAPTHTTSTQGLLWLSRAQLPGMRRRCAHGSQSAAGGWAAGPLETAASRGRERDCGLEPGAKGALEAQDRHLPLPARMSSSESETRTGREEERKDKMAGLDWTPTSLRASQPGQTTRTPLSHSCHPGPLQRKEGGTSDDLGPTCRQLRNGRWNWAFRGVAPDAMPRPPTLEASVR